MAISLKHTFHSEKDDGADDSVVRPTDWNAEHKFESTTDGIVLGRPTGAGPGPIQEMSMSAMWPTGAIIPFAGETAPSGWHLCRGQTLSRETYKALHTVIGERYGVGDGFSTFTLPDMRGRVVAGVDPEGVRMNSDGLGANPTIVGAVGGYQVITYKTLLSGLEVAGGSNINGAPWHQNFGGVWGYPFGAIRVGGTTDGPFGGSMGAPGSGTNTSVDTHKHNFLGTGFLGYGQSETNEGYNSPFIDPGNGSRGRFHGVTITHYPSGNQQERWTESNSNVQPTIMMNYIIKD